jgi:uncharacterized protein YoxC
MTIAALIAAISFALLALAGIVALVKLTRFLSASTSLITLLHDRGDVLIDRAQAAVDGAQAAVDRAGRQLDRTESVTASMDELGAGMADLAGQVNALAGFGRTMAGVVVSGPVGKAAALAYGVRHAVSLRRGGPRNAVPGKVVGGIGGGAPGAAGRGTELSR